MKSKYAILIPLVLAKFLVAQTPIYQGTIDGDIWTSENSPYIIKGDITIEDLTIQAGVEVIFESDYKFEVNRVLQAQGFYSDSIYFKPDSLNTNGWEGIKFKNTAVASSIIYCRIEGANDQGISIDQSIPTILNCRIVYNDGYGIELKDTNIALKHCIISHNTSNGIHLDASQISAVNSIITGNTLSGIHSTNNNDAITLLNTVIADNQSIGISCQRGALTVKNSIIFDNNSQIFMVEQTPDVSYSAIQGATIYPGTGNINSPPNFENSSLYTLLPQSPCVDAGDPSGTYNDKYFPPSLGSSRNDMGAYGGPEACGWYPPLYVKPQNIAFGKVSQDSSKYISVNVLNYRNLDIAVSQIIFQGDSEHVFASDKQNLVIPVLDSLELVLSFLPDQESIFQADLVLPTLSHGDVFVPLSGEGIVPKMDVKLSELDFNRVTLGDSTSLYLPIENSGSDTLRLNMMLLSNSAFNLSESSLEINPESSLDSIEVTFEPNLPTIFQDSLIILSNDPEKRRVAVLVKGEGIGPVIHLDTEMIDFGNVSVFSDTSFNLTISNLGNDQLIIDSLKIVGQDPDSIAFELINIPQEFPVTLDPDNSIIVQMDFTPIKAGMVNAQIRIKSSDPFGEETLVGLCGTGIAGSLNLSATELNFSEVPLNSQSVLDLTLSNKGADVLTIDSLKIIGQDPESFVFEIINTIPKLPLILEPDSSMIVQIGFTPIKAGMVNAQIKIKSRDPFGEEALVGLSGTGIAAAIVLSTTELDFGQVSLDSDSLKTFYIHNRGLAALFIPYDSLSIIGTHDDAYLMENITEDITVVHGDSAALNIRFQPVQTGINQADLKISSNDPIDSGLVVKLSGIGFDTSPVSIEFDKLLSSNPFSNGQSATISFIITGSQSTDSAFVYVRPGGTVAYTRLPLNRQSNESWSAQIDASLITERGVEYFVHAHHGKISTYHPTNGSDMPIGIQVAVPQIQFPWQTKNEIYQMISIPLATSGQDLKTLFEDELGPYDNTKYRIFDLSDGSQYTEVVSMNDTLPPGKAIWLITKDVQDLSISNAQSMITDSNFELHLQKGWNLIATPFAFPVDWNQVSSNLGLRYYDGTDWPFATLLQPFKGYAVNVPNDTVLLIPPREAPTVMKSVKMNQNQLVEEWRIQVLAESANLKDQFNYVGAFEQATSGIDCYDYPEPPPIGDFISLYLSPDNASEKYSTDYRELGMGQYVFEFEVSCNIKEKIKIFFREENLPEYYDWIVVSEEKGIYYPQRVVQITEEQSRYKMIIGTEQYIADAKSNFKQLPLTYNLEQNYPNPFNPSTTIKFSLPKASIVTINLYNILGQKINNLLKEANMEAGFYQIEWDGKNASGEQVSSGMYFLQLKSEMYDHYIKMVLNR